MGSGKVSISSSRDKFTGDLILARRAATGDHKARCQIAERLFARICTSVRYLAGGDRDADDMVQISLMELMKSLGNYRGEGSLEAWADRITVRTTRRGLRRRRRKEEVVRILEQPECVDTTPEPVQGKLREHLALALKKLPGRKRRVVVLRWLYQYSLEEIAAITESPVNTVRDRLRTGRKQLRKTILKDPVLRDFLPLSGIEDGNAG
jgi:RNA polymerase sigma-70 factor (ECF subfamily)